MGCDCCCHETLENAGYLGCCFSCEAEHDPLRNALLQNEEARKEILKYRRMLWVLARKEGLSLQIPKADFDLVPDEAELLSWYEPLFDAWMLKGICSPINQPDLAKPVVEKPKQEGDGHMCFAMEDVPCSLCGRLAEKRKCEHTWTETQCSTCGDPKPDYKRECEHEWSHIEDSHFFCAKCRATADFCGTCGAEYTKTRDGGLVCLKCHPQ